MSSGRSTSFKKEIARQTVYYAFNRRKMANQYYVIHVLVLLNHWHVIWRVNCRDCQTTKSEPILVKQNIFQESSNQKSENKEIRNYN